MSCLQNRKEIDKRLMLALQLTRKIDQVIKQVSETINVESLMLALRKSTFINDTFIILFL